MKRKSFKFTLAVLVCMGLAALAGCGKKDPYTVYSEAVTKTSALESQKAAANMSLSFSAAGETMDIDTKYDMKMSGINTDNMAADIKVAASMLGQATDMQIYYNDGYYYMANGESKIKYPMDLAEFEKQLTTTTINTDLKKESFKEIALEKKDKNYLLTFTIKGETMSSIVDSALSGMQGLTDSVDLKMTVGDIAGTATVNKDDYITDMKMNVPVTMTVTDQEMTMDIDMAVTYIDPGKKVTVELPDDLDSYEEIDMNAAGAADSRATVGGADEPGVTPGIDAPDGAFTDGTAAEDANPADDTDTAADDAAQPAA